MFILIVIILKSIINFDDIINVGELSQQDIIFNMR